MTHQEIRDALDDLQSEQEEIDTDLEGWKIELEELLGQIKTAQARRHEIRNRRAELRAKLAELKTVWCG
jgi:predicted  nucleic acid-binding Zn-ribbon protein